jgi:hypothetical protein
MKKTVPVDDNKANNRVEPEQVAIKDPDEIDAMAEEVTSSLLLKNIKQRLQNEGG